MKRDWELVREVLIELEALPRCNNFSYSGSDGAKAEQAIELWEAGLLDGIDAGSSDGPSILSSKLT